MMNRLFRRWQKNMTIYVKDDKNQFLYICKYTIQIKNKKQASY